MRTRLSRGGHVERASHEALCRMRFAEAHPLFLRPLTTHALLDAFDGIGGHPPAQPVGARDLHPAGARTANVDERAFGQAEVFLPRRRRLETSNVASRSRHDA